MTIKLFELEKRIEGIGPIFVDSYCLGQKIEQWNIEPGNNVTLKCDGISIITDVVEADGSKYKGKIVGFEGYSEECLHGKCLEDTIEFSLEHIFGCSR